MGLSRPGSSGCGSRPAWQPSRSLEVVCAAGSLVPTRGGGPSPPFQCPDRPGRFFFFPFPPAFENPGHTTRAQPPSSSCLKTAGLSLCCPAASSTSSHTRGHRRPSSRGRAHSVRRQRGGLARAGREPSPTPGTHRSAPSGQRGSGLIPPGSADRPHNQPTETPGRGRPGRADGHFLQVFGQCPLICMHLH